MTLEEQAARAFELFRTPLSRDVSPKALRALTGATRTSIPHAQILDWPPTSRPHATLAGFVWEASAETDEAESAPTVLLVHGWELQAGRMGALVPPLLAAGFRVAAFDLPAHGQSEGSESTMLDWAEAIRNAIGFFGNVRAVVAHSFGAQSLYWLLAQPQNPGLQKIVTLGGASDMEFIFAASPRFQGATPELIQAVRAEFHRRVGRWPHEMDSARAATAINIPALVIHDERDPVVPFAHGRAYARSLPNARLLATSGLGHTAVLRDAEVIAAIVAFLSA